MRFLDILHARFNSAAARKILGLLYRPDRTYRVRFGPLRGARMFYDRSINYHAILGLWDGETFGTLNRVFVRSGLLPQDCTVADVGGNIGYYTMWLAKVVSAAGCVYAFEPNPDASRILQYNLDVNHIRNARVVEMACGDREGETEFFVGRHHHCSSLHQEWAAGEERIARKINAEMTTLDRFFGVAANRRPPRFIKIDIEGGGTFALPGCRGLLADSRPFVLIESHTPEEDRAISDVLCQFDYRGYRLNDKKWVKEPEKVHPNRDGVWGTLLLIPAEHYSRVSASLS